ncbi:unnamed protein product, partial [Musa textilis]
VASPHAPPADSPTIPDPAPLEVRLLLDAFAFLKIFMVPEFAGQDRQCRSRQGTAMVNLSEPTGESPTAAVVEELDPRISELKLVDETEAANTDGKEKPVAAEESPLQRV